jgi:hypothetical protein
LQCNTLKLDELQEIFDEWTVILNLSFGQLYNGRRGRLIFFGEGFWLWGMGIVLGFGL